MDENLHKDNLEEFFKNSFDEENVEPSDDQWDVPSNTVWSNINASIQPVVPVTSSIFTLKKLLAVAASILILALVCYNLILQNQVAELKQVLENQINTIDELEKLVLENESKTGESSDLESEQIEEFSSIFPEKKSNKTKVDPTLQNNPKAISNQNNVLKNNSTPSIFEEDKSVSNPQLTNSEAANSNSKSENTETDLAITQPSSKTNDGVSNPNNNHSQTIISDQDHQKSSTPNSSESLGKSITFLMPLDSKNIFAEPSPYAEKMTLEILPVNAEVQKPMAATTSRVGFYAGAHIAPTYSYRNIKSIDGPVLRQKLNQQEKAIYSVSLGLKGGYQFSKNWSVETGLNYYKNTIQSMHRAQIRYESQIERLNSDGNYDSNYQVNLPTSYGEIETDVALTRNSDTQIDQNDYINMALKTQQELKNLGIPIAIRYRTAKNKLHFSAKAGFSANFILQKDVTIKAAVVNRNGVHHRRTIIDKQFSGLKNTTIDILLGLGLDYDISKNMSVYFEPTVTRSLNPVYHINGKIKTYPILASFNLGLNYHF